MILQHYLVGPTCIHAYVCCGIIFFAFFYTSIVFNPVETADNLKRQGGFIPGIRPGEKTAEYIDFVLSRITTIGALYLAFVCILPEILIAQYQFILFGRYITTHCCGCRYGYCWTNSKSFVCISI